ncbi:MAG: hypothetical protein H6836_09685 [Planctomycetes bacterium]|nr:hypothetical protein [Planctomycetota bacterium]MCB9889834.1 hypothetical protein [Planctomycetota bacterium]
MVETKGFMEGPLDHHLAIEDGKGPRSNDLVAHTGGVFRVFLHPRQRWLDGVERSAWSLPRERMSGI